ncbi:MAG: hypothetical protein HGB12_13480, partial [Bacteroidetes bacterium]|nr:hypothetical protein [Bacteroidota bacterium]
MKTNKIIKVLRNIVYALLITFFQLSIFNCSAQGVAINTTGAEADNKAMLDVSGASQGVLLNRMTTTERDAITGTIPESLLIYNTTTKCFEAYVNGTWNIVSCPTACIPPAAPTANAASDLGCTSFKANWSASTGATSYYLDVSINSDFSTLVAGYNNLNVNTLTSYSVTGLTS